MQIVMGVLVGVGLSAACGFRLFLPMLMLSVGSYSGYLKLGDGMAWAGSAPALTAFAVATLVEVAGYLIPWVDHALDVVAVPLSVAAGTVLTASFVTEMDPMLRWSLALLVGGGTAGGVRTSLATVRASSTAATGGLANPLVGLAEGLMSFVMTVLALVVPILAVALLLLIALLMIRIVRKFPFPPRRRREPGVP
jgi:hypothetical protein